MEFNWKIICFPKLIYIYRPRTMNIDWWNVIQSVIAPLIAASLGAYTAYYLAQNQEKSKKELDEVGAIRRAQFQMLHQYHLLKELWEQIYKPYKENPERWILIEDVMPIEFENIGGNVKDLYGLVEAGKSQAVYNFLTAQDRVRQLVDKINQRSSVYLREVRLKFETNGLYNSRNSIPIMVIQETIDANTIQYLKKLTDAIINRLEIEIPKLEQNFHFLGDCN